MAKIAQYRRQLLRADARVVRQLYDNACARFGTAEVARDLRFLWTMRCMMGVDGRLPFDGGMVSRTLGEVMYVAREVCGLGQA